MGIASVNPTTGETERTFSPLTAEALEDKLARAATAAAAWRRTAVGDRTQVLARAAEILERESDAMGRLMTLEMGKVLSAAIEEARKSAAGCRYYVENGARLLAPEVVRDAAGERDMVVYQPLGAVLAVMPWNFPFWQVIRVAAPALAAGNVALLKHASNVPQCALALEDLFRRAGAPDGVFQALLIGSDAVPAIIADPRVAAVTLTGSEPAGRLVAATAGGHLKKTVLELGGSDPFIVMPSADLERTVAMAVKARMVNNGQSCIAAKRFIVADDIYDRFASRFVTAVAALRVGDPTAPDTDVGPLATPPILDALAAQVRESVAAGARLLTGGHRLDRRGNFYAPTVLAEVPRAAPAYSDEVFGPVALLFRVADIDAAIQLANDTGFGLGASAWTRDRAEADRFIDELDAGMVFVNEQVVSDPRLPFGGVKRSGYGRELGALGLREFVNAKTVRTSGLPPV
ncbi:MAG TPA: NAD-dependent succinate-semialdehyde dehydrogenase [Polyangia bacterium]|nr:NAD-dependent succinate-semialdehyde dehydrogenase [Polyangia bacterium]